MKKKFIHCFVTLCLTSSIFAGCAVPKEVAPPSTPVETKAETATSIFDINNATWKFNAEDQVYWQVGLVYCENPVATDYESLGIYVPAAYMNAKDNGDGTYTCTPSTEGTMNGYTAASAPIVMPVNTPGYAAQAAPTGYTSGLNAYLDAGYVYVIAGCRGRAMMGGPGGSGGPGGPGGFGGPNASAPSGEKPDLADGNAIPTGKEAIPPVNSSDTKSGDTTKTYTNSAPWAVTDLKSAVRYLRYNAAALPGDTKQIFTFGMSGGGAQSALMGVTGDSPLYTPYLESIGAPMTDATGKALSDAVAGAMSWCPITSLDYADEAYEWNMGQYVNTDTRAEGLFTKALSNDLAAAFAPYINTLGLTSEDGTALSLEASSDGIYNKGTYYDYIITVIENSLNHFLSDTTFPYTPDNSMQAGFAGNAGGNNGNSVSNTNTTTYATVEDYIAFLNAEGAWIDYDKATNTAKITSMSGFVNTVKTASKGVGAFDSLNKNAGENQVFGDDANNPLHFDPVMADLLNKNQGTYAAFSDWQPAYPSDYTTDIAYVNGIGSTVESRVDMYNPMYYISKAYKGYGTSTVAPNIRIRTGLFQGDTALTVESNLALALSQYPGVSVDFETVWGQHHTTAERTGDATTNFVEWVGACTK